jgi:ATP-dependent Lon protease
MENKLHFIPVVPMRGVMVFPGMNLNFDAGREMSIKGLANASEENSLVFLVAQKDAEKEKPKLEDLYNIGTISQEQYDAIKDYERSMYLKNTELEPLSSQIAKMQSDLVIYEAQLTHPLL